MKAINISVANFLALLEKPGVIFTQLDFCAFLVFPHKCVEGTEKEKWDEVSPLIHVVHCCHHGPPGLQVGNSSTID